MAIVEWMVNTSEEFLEHAARNTFLSLVEASGTLVGYMSVLAVALIGVNMMLQFRAISWQASLGLIIKLAAIGIFAWNWNQFWAVANGIIESLENIAGGILAASPGDFGGPTVGDGFAAAIDTMLDDFSTAATNVADDMGGWLLTAIVSGICLFLIACIAAFSAVLIVFTKIVITILLGLAPLAIAMTLFQTTKNYFERWISSAVNWSLYPIFIASIFAIMIAMGTKMINDLGTDNFENIGAFIPFVALEILVIISIVFLPMIVGSVSGSIQIIGAMMGARAAASNIGTMARAGVGSFGAARSFGSMPWQTFRGQNALGRAGYRAGAGIAGTLNRMQERARLLRR